MWFLEKKKKTYIILAVMNNTQETIKSYTQGVTRRWFTLHTAKKNI